MAEVARHQLSISSDVGDLARLRRWLDARLQPYALSDEVRNGLVVAVGELCVNSIRHAYAGEPIHPINVSVEDRGDALVIEVEDFGRRFDPQRYVPPDPDVVHEGGLGLYIVRQVADELSWDIARPAGTRWTVLKRL